MSADSDGIHGDGLKAEEVFRVKNLDTGEELDISEYDFDPESRRQDAHASTSETTAQAVTNKRDKWNITKWTKTAVAQAKKARDAVRHAVDKTTGLAHSQQRTDSDPGDGVHHSANKHPKTSLQVDGHPISQPTPTLLSGAVALNSETGRDPVHQPSTSLPQVSSTSAASADATYSTTSLYPTPTTAATYPSFPPTPFQASIQPSSLNPFNVPHQLDTDPSLAKAASDPSVVSLTPSSTSISSHQTSSPTEPLPPAPSSSSTGHSSSLSHQPSLPLELLPQVPSSSSTGRSSPLSRSFPLSSSSSSNFHQSSSGSGAPPASSSSTSMAVSNAAKAPRNAVKTWASTKVPKYLGTVTMVQRLLGHSGVVWAAKLSRDGQLLATAGQDAVACVWSLFRPQASLHPSPVTDEEEEQLVFIPTPVRSYRGHTADVLDLAWTRSRFILTASADCTVRLWHLREEECLRSFTHPDIVTSVDAHPSDPNCFVSGCMDGNLRVWSVRDGSAMSTVSLHDMVTAVAVSLDGTRVFTGTFKGRCKVFTLQDGQAEYLTQVDVRNASGTGGEKKICDIINVPGSPAHFVVASNDSRLRLYDGQAGFTVTQKYKGHKSVSTQLRPSTSSNGELLLSGSEDGKVFLWEARDASSSPASKNSSYESFYANEGAITCVLCVPPGPRSARPTRPQAGLANDSTTMGAVGKGVSQTEVMASSSEGSHMSGGEEASRKGASQGISGQGNTNSRAGSGGEEGAGRRDLAGSQRAWLVVTTGFVGEVQVFRVEPPKPP